MTTGNSSRHGTTGPDPCDGECSVHGPGHPSGCRACTCGHGHAADWTNPPGRDSLSYGRTRYNPALERMMARLGAADLPALKSLTARSTEPPLDPALALLDGWACLGQVLGFYNERSVNEHYLRTCHERRSALELARLVGYTPRPGVAAETCLAFTLEDRDLEATLQVPAGTPAQSVPGPGETMQTYETIEELSGRPRWNRMKPRLTRPQRITRATRTVHVEGLATGLGEGDTLLVTIGAAHHRWVVTGVEALPKEGRTRLDVEIGQQPRDTADHGGVSSATLEGMVTPPATNREPRENLVLDPATIFSRGSYAPYGLLESAYPSLRGQLGSALRGVVAAVPITSVSVAVMRGQASLHGSTAQPFPVFDSGNGQITGYVGWNAGGTALDNAPAGSTFNSSVSAPLGDLELALDAEYKRVVPGSRILITGDGRADTDDVDVYTVDAVRTETRNNFNVTARVTVLTLDRRWWKTNEQGDVRQTVVHFDGEELALADVPDDDDVGPDAKGVQGPLELDDYYEGLRPGRRVVITGERTDLGLPGVLGTELLMVSAVEHRVATARRGRVSSDTVHTFLTFAEPRLRFRYRRDTVSVLGNIAAATHGASRSEVLGSGDPARAFQQFPLKQGPLTYLAAPTPTGVQSTLETVVNDLRWHETDDPALTAHDARQYFLRTDDGGSTAVVFGFGARLPAGRDNVRARYRSGLGAPGNARAGQINVLASRPNGVTGVTNPIAATGGTDREGTAGIKHRAPIGLSALDRLVSATDVEDFARAFAGIGKARVTAAGGAPPPRSYTLVVAGVDDNPLPLTSPPLRNLREALIRYGNLRPGGNDSTLRTTGSPVATIRLQPRKALLIALRATVHLQPDHLWEAVLPRMRAQLLHVLGFDARDIAQPLHPDEVITALLSVSGVAWAHLQAFGTIDTGTPESPRAPEYVADAASDLLSATGTPVSLRPQEVKPSEIAYLSATAPGTLLLVPR